MAKQKKKFKPVITKVKLNPEQAVLSCCTHPHGKIQSPGENTYCDGCGIGASREYSAT